MLFIVQKERIRRIVLASYELIALKEATQKLREAYYFLEKAKEEESELLQLSYKIDRTTVKIMLLKRYITSRIEAILNLYNITLESPITHITRSQLEEGYINLSSLDGEDNENDLILSLTIGIVYELHKDNKIFSVSSSFKTNALKYHGII